MNWFKNLFRLKELLLDMDALKAVVGHQSDQIALLQADTQALKNFIETKREPDFKPRKNDIEKEDDSDVEIDESFKFPLVNGHTKVRFEDEPEDKAVTVQIF